MPIFDSECTPEALAAFCKALAHPVRVQILKILLERGACISGEISLGIEKAASTVSEHLRILKESGLVQGTIDGPRRCYCVNQRAVVHFQDLVGRLASPESDCCRVPRAALSGLESSTDACLLPVASDRSCTQKESRDGHL